MNIQTKKDGWIMVVLYGITISLWAFSIYSIVNTPDNLKNNVLNFLVAVLITSLLFINYKIDQSFLYVNAGPFRWKVKITDITKIEKSDSSFSAPALSMDRVKIYYNGNGRLKSVVISPNDKQLLIDTLKKYGVKEDSFKI